MNDWTIHEDLIKNTDYQLAGPLPDPFVFDDGTPVKTPADWTKRRQELYKSAVELQYGTIPPQTRVFGGGAALFVSSRQLPHPHRHTEKAFHDESASVSPQGCCQSPCGGGR